MSKYNVRISIQNIALYCAFLLIFKPHLISNSVWYVYEAIVLVLLTTYIIYKIRFKGLFNISLYYCIGIICLSLINYWRGFIFIHEMLRCIINCVTLSYIYDLLYLFHLNQKQRDALKCFINILSLYCVINTISVMKLGIVEKYSNIVYFFGNKFRVCYFLIFLLGVIYSYIYDMISHYKLIKIGYLIGITLSAFFAFYIGCSTGVVAISLIFVLNFLPINARRIITNSRMMITTLISCGLIVLLVKYILNLRIIQYIVINVLHEDITLTGRLNIYTNFLFPLIRQHPLIGYGYDNTIMSSTSFWYANAQNGMFDYVLANGLIGLSFFFIMIFWCLNKSIFAEYKYGLYMTYISLAFASIVEPTFGSFMIVIVFLIRWTFGNRESQV